MKKSKLIDKCTGLRQSIEARSLATDTEIEKYWPKKSDNMETWIFCYAQMVRFRGRSEFLAKGTLHAQDELLDALRDEPKQVTLLDGSLVKVYPKSHDSLRWLSFHGFVLAWLAIHSRILTESITEGTAHEIEYLEHPMSVLEATVMEQSIQTSMLYWVCCHPGPGMPFTVSGSYDIKKEDIPSQFVDLHPMDIFRLHEAFLAVNAIRLSYLQKAEDGKSITFDVFFAQRSRQTGISAKDLMMDYSLASQLVEVGLSSPTASEVFS